MLNSGCVSLPQIKSRLKLTHLLLQHPSKALGGTGDMGMGCFTPAESLVWIRGFWSYDFVGDSISTAQGCPVPGGEAPWMPS